MKGTRAALTTLALLLGLVSPALAQSPESASLAFAYDLDSDTPIYPTLAGKNGDPFGGGIHGTAAIETSGSSTSVTESVAGSNPFAEMAVGDVLLVRRPDGTVDKRVIVTYTDDSNVVVDTAVDWSGGFRFEWYDASFGTAATSGWVDTSRFSGGVKFTIQYEQGDLATGFQYWVECETEGLDPKPNLVYPGETSDCGPGGTLVSNTCQIATAGATTSRVAVVITPEENTGKCRVGIQRNGADTSDAGANIERVSISVTGRVIR